MAHSTSLSRLVNIYNISNTIQNSGARKPGNMARGDWYHLSTAIYTRLGIRRRPADKPLPTHGGHKIFQYTLQYSYYVSFQCARTPDMPVHECLRGINEVLRLAGARDISQEWERNQGSHNLRTAFIPISYYSSPNQRTWLLLTSVQNSSWIGISHIAGSSLVG